MKILPVSYRNVPSSKSVQKPSFSGLSEAEKQDLISKIDKELKNIEVEKYLLDEYNENVKTQIEEANKQEDEEREKYGPTYNMSYPPSQVYYRRTFLQNLYRDNAQKSAELQRRYDNLLAQKSYLQK